MYKTGVSNLINMSGHSQFANIKHRKDAQDAKKSKKFIKLIKEINVAVRQKGADPNENSALRLCLDKARKMNMPKSTYEKAMKIKNNDSANYEDIRYEGYINKKIAVIVDCLTDNKKRTAANVKSYFNSCNGSLSQTNAVAYLFKTIAYIEFELDDLNQDQVWEEMLKVDIKDLKFNNKIVIVYCEPNLEKNIKKFIINNFKEAKIITSNVITTPITEITVNDNDKLIIDKFHKFINDDFDITKIILNTKYLKNKKENN